MRDNKMWKYKTDCKGEPTTAVNRRIKRCGTSDLSTHKGRLKFGYAYFEYVGDGSNLTREEEKYVLD